MIQRDIIQQQIEQLGRALGKIITGFLGLKTQGNVMEGFKIANQQFKNELDMDIDKLLALDKVSMMDYLEDKPFTSDHLGQIAEYIEVLGDHQSDNAARTNAFGTAINLLEIANERSATYDMERQIKRQFLEKKLNDEKA